MTAAWGQVARIVTVVMMLLFVGIWIWVWLPRHKRTFDSLATLPMSDCDVSAADTIQAAGEEQRR